MSKSKNLLEFFNLAECPSCKAMKPVKEVVAFGNCADCYLEDIY